MSNGTTDALRILGNISLTTAKSNNDKSWEEPATQAQEHPTIVPKAHTPLSRLAANLRRPERGAQARETAEAEEPTEEGQGTTPPEPVEEAPKPKQAAREVVALKCTNILGTNDFPTRNTRSRCSTIAALTLLSNSRASGAQWRPRNMHNSDSPMSPLAELASTVLEGDTILKYIQLLRLPLFGPAWNTSSANKFGSLAQGVGGRMKGTDTIFFINKEDMPLDKLMHVTHAQFVCNIRPEKEEKNRTRCVAEGNKINYPFDIGTPTADMLLVKFLFNSIISTKGATVMTADIKKFYLVTPLKRWEYIKLKLSDIPAEVIKEYNLMEKATKDRSVYVEVRRGIYGLPQAGLLAQEQLSESLEEHGYYQSKMVPGLWHHRIRPSTFTLVIDGFGLKYTYEADAQHLMSVLKQHYDITEDWKDERYIGMHLQWDYKGIMVHMAMPGYIDKALKEFQHEQPPRQQS